MSAERPQFQPPELLDQETQQKLSPLRSGEKTGLDTLAPVKYFTPDGGWTWYASEAVFDHRNGCHLITKVASD
jgi:hypothetical protein